MRARRRSPGAAAGTAGQHGAAVTAKTFLISIAHSSGGKFNNTDGSSSKMSGTLWVSMSQRLKSTSIVLLYSWQSTTLLLSSIVGVKFRDEYQSTERFHSKLCIISERDHLREKHLPRMPVTRAEPVCRLTSVSSAATFQLPVKHLPNT